MVLKKAAIGLFVLSIVFLLKEELIMAMSKKASRKKMTKYSGKSIKGVDTASLNGKIMCGYQGWFRTPGDGSGNRWSHWGKMDPSNIGQCRFDLWPDMTEYDDDEKYPTGFKHPDGSTAYVFSSYNKKTVFRHFKWMKEYNIDGVFVQRFFGRTKHFERKFDTVEIIDYCREGANTYGRAYGLMYDLSGMGKNMYQYVMKDWKTLVDHMGLSRDKNDKAYINHKGKPVVVLWGIGFDDNRKYTLQDCMKLVEFFKDDPVYGGNTVMLGTPTGWRELKKERHYVPRVKQRHIVMDGDCIPDKYIHEIIKKADIISPWTVDRYVDDKGINYIATNIWAKDVKWCNKNNIEFMPVVFPGFSWHNLFPTEKTNAIPRRKGKFLWKQYHEVIKLGIPMIYQAMSDEVNESTAIFKCSNDPPEPINGNVFITYEGLPTDHYLWLVGMANRMLNKKIPLSPVIPKRK